MEIVAGKSMGRTFTWDNRGELVLLCFIYFQVQLGLLSKDMHTGDKGDNIGQPNFFSKN